MPTEGKEASFGKGLLSEQHGAHHPNAEQEGPSEGLKGSQEHVGRQH